MCVFSNIVRTIIGCEDILANPHIFSSFLWRLRFDFRVRIRSNFKLEQGLGLSIELVWVRTKAMHYFKDCPH